MPSWAARYLRTSKSTKTWRANAPRRSRDKMLDPSYSLRAISVKRRQPNPWFKRGTVYRRAVDALRTAAEPLTAGEIAERVLETANVANPDKGTHQLVKLQDALLIPIGEHREVPGRQAVAVPADAQRTAQIEERLHGQIQDWAGAGHPDPVRRAQAPQRPAAVPRRGHDHRRGPVPVPERPRL